MHINHRRKNKFRVKHHGAGHAHGLYVYSLSWWKQFSSRERRAKANCLIRNGKFDRLPIQYKRDILWQYW